MERELSDLLNEVGMDREELARLCGVSVKTTYWKDIPEYAITILSQRYQLNNYERFKSALKGLDHELHLTVEVIDLSKIV